MLPVGTAADPQDVGQTATAIVQDWVKQFVSELHYRGLKPLGFTKKSHTFSRRREGYIERVQVQGSSWNSADDPSWTFYLNAGVFFPELPEPRANRGFIGTHAYGRLRDFDQACEDAFDLRRDEVATTRVEVLSSVEIASRAIEMDLHSLREFAATGRFMWTTRLRRESP